MIPYRYGFTTWRLSRDDAGAIMLGRTVIVTNDHDTMIALLTDAGLDRFALELMSGASDQALTLGSSLDRPRIARALVAMGRQARPDLYDRDTAMLLSQEIEEQDATLPLSIVRQVDVGAFAVEERFGRADAALDIPGFLRSRRESGRPSRARGLLTSLGLRKAS